MPHRIVGRADGVVDGVDGGHAGLEHPQRSIVNGRFTRFTMKPGASAQRTVALPHEAIMDSARRATVGSVRSVTTTSTSAIRGTG
jgi:hypothetical protein